MYSITTRRWFFPAILALALLAEMFALRANWRTDTQKNAKLRSLEVRSGFGLMLQNRASKADQPILSYNANPKHDHRLTVDIQKARLSDESLRLLAMAHPPNTAGRLIYAPDPNEPKSSEPSCLMAFRVEFPAQAKATERIVAIAPPVPEDVFDKAATRLVHLSSNSPLVVRLSANSPDGKSGPACRNLLSIGDWQQMIGKDLELAFVADAGSPVEITLSSPSFHSGKNEVESLEIEHLLPQRLWTQPSNIKRIEQMREFAGDPALTVTDLRLGGDLLNVELSGKAGIPIPEMLGWTKWPILTLLDIPLLVLAIQVFRLKKTIFLSYSWADRERVMPIYEKLKRAGLDVWIDRDQLRAGDDWEERIRGEMLKSRRIVVFLSHSLNDGGFLLAELALARAIAGDRIKREHFIIPVRLENCPLPPILAQWNALDLFEADGERRLLEDLGAAPTTA